MLYPEGWFFWPFGGPQVQKTNLFLFIIYSFFSFFFLTFNCHTASFKLILQLICNFIMETEGTSVCFPPSFIIDLQILCTLEKIYCISILISLLMFWEKFRYTLDGVGTVWWGTMYTHCSTVKERPNQTGCLWMWNDSQYVDLEQL